MSNNAAVMPEPGRIEIQDVGEPSAGPRDAIVQIEAVGVCGSDNAYYTVGRIGDYIVDGPIILGHECSGTVLSVGDEVTGVSVGDRVAIEPGKPCRDCRDCMAGRYHLCPDLVFFATPPYDGSLVQRMAIDERQLFRMPDSMTFEQGALCEPLSVGIWACKRAGLEPGDRVLVTGAGPVGLLAAQVARAFGAASVTVADIADFRLDMARGLGFDVEKAGEGTENDFDVLLECSGAPTALADGLWRLRTNGRAAMVGMPKQDVSLALSRLNVNELTIGLVNRYAHTWPIAIDLVSSGRVDVDSLVTHRFALDQTAEALMLAKTVPDSVKAVIAPQRLSA
ncbi:L-iditol 2-dehydrogenase [Microbacterium sp. W4I4]|uniref:NAD(P)-dependent alcohol dehydrogenase n=1 Tax=Microbacterium sp. W4I4 TaxID=3042295 RepID=UPI002787EDC5|nr:NAD(P)-dependent alcohol dehydrogenase [Microbacterium sp. W4I4]MDQ0614443.1 L-iditol 2-dehydrogenase [Microbacterium sp. W4I4]